MDLRAFEDPDTSTFSHDYESISRSDRRDVNLRVSHNIRWAGLELRCRCFFRIACRIFSVPVFGCWQVNAASCDIQGTKWVLLPVFGCWRVCGDIRCRNILVAKDGTSRRSFNLVDCILGHVEGFIRQVLLIKILQGIDVAVVILQGIDVAVVILGTRLNVAVTDSVAFPA